MNYCMKCGKPVDNGMVCEDCMVNNSPWLLAMKIKENDLEQEIAELKAENAELEARLERAVELKAKVGDTVYMPWVYDGNAAVATLLIIDIHFLNSGFVYITNLVSDSAVYLAKYKYGIFRSEDFGNTVFTDRVEAEKRLTELQEEKK